MSFPEIVAVRGTVCRIQGQYRHHGAVDQCASEDHHAERTQRYAQAIRSSGADEVIIPEYEGGRMTGRMIERYYPAHRTLP
jgi:hypothetical protein